jgi:hypothetical protein
MITGHSQNHRIWDAFPLIERLAPLGLEYWKAIDPPADAAKAIADLGVKLIVRHVFDGPENTGPSVWPTQWLAEVRAAEWYPYAWAVETANEPFPGQDVPAWWATEESRIIVALAMDGKETIVCNRGVGHDGYYVPGARWYGTHEYDFPYLLTNTPWQSLRYRTWFPAVQARRPNARLFLTEFGVTHAVVPGYDDVGYRSIGQSPETFWDDSVKPYLLRLADDGVVEAACLYQIGGLHAGEGSKDWSSFECVGTSIEDRIAEWYGSAAPDPKQPSTPSQAEESDVTNEHLNELERCAAIADNWARLSEAQVSAAESFGYDITNSLDKRRADELRSMVNSIRAVISANPR